MKLTIDNLNKSFGDNNVLKGISFEAVGGKAVGILGRNGAGKTTTIRIAMGVFNADSGSVLFDDKPINYDKVKLGYLPEERGLYPKKVVLEQLVYLGRLKGLTKAQAITSADYWLERLGMMQYRNKKLETLSKGNSQKIQLVATLIADPDIVILDEPFSGLDPVNAMLLKDVVKELIAKNKIVLFSSHQMNYIEEFCDDIVILNGGEVALGGSIKEIKRSYDRRTIIVSSFENDKIKAFLDEESTIQGDKLVVTLKSSKDKNSFISKISSENFDIDSITVYEPTLADIFVEYTKEGL